MTKPNRENMGTYDQSAYPELWRNCVRAIAPCLGASRFVEDYSRRHVINPLSGSFGHLVNGWVKSEGQWAFYPTASGSPIITIGNSSTGRTTAIGGARLWSVSQWMYPLSHTAGQVIYRETIASSSIATRAGMLTGTSGVVNVTIRDTDGGIDQTWLTNGVTPLNQWSHVAATINRFTGELKVYINGVEQTFSASGTVGIVDWATTEGHSAGCRWATGFNGYVDDLMIFHRIITPEDIRLLSKYRGIAYTPRRFRRAHYDGATIPPAPTIRFFPRRFFNRVLP